MLERQIRQQRIQIRKDMSEMLVSKAYATALGLVPITHKYILRNWESREAAWHVWKDLLLDPRGRCPRFVRIDPNAARFAHIEVWAKPIKSQ